MNGISVRGLTTVHSRTAFAGLTLTTPFCLLKAVRSKLLNNTPCMSNGLSIS
jgi:hypothetical protein